MSLTENAERVRRIVPIAERADRTDVVHATARFLEAYPATPQDQIHVIFTAIAWSRDRHLWKANEALL